jgi:LPXTG-motif cell wall-anchored protein
MSDFWSEYIENLPSIPPISTSSDLEDKIKVFNNSIAQKDTKSTNSNMTAYIVLGTVSATLLGTIIYFITKKKK